MAESARAGAGPGGATPCQSARVIDWGEGDYARTAAVLAPAAEALVEATGVAPGERVLDVGCGTGNAALAAAARGARATGVTRPSGSSTRNAPMGSSEESSSPSGSWASFLGDLDVGPAHDRRVAVITGAMLLVVAAGLAKPLLKLTRRALARRNHDPGRGGAER
jgi:hypothetical protein